MRRPKKRLELDVQMIRVALVSTFFLVACGAPNVSEVTATFLVETPQAQIESLGPGEGDGANVYYHIKYRLPPDTIIWEQIWLYQKGNDEKWRVTSRDTTIAKRAT